VVRKALVRTGKRRVSSGSTELGIRPGIRPDSSALLSRCLGIGDSYEIIPEFQLSKEFKHSFGARLKHYSRVPALILKCSNPVFATRFKTLLLWSTLRRSSKSVLPKVVQSLYCLRVKTLSRVPLSVCVKTLS